MPNRLIPAVPSSEVGSAVAACLQAALAARHGDAFVTYDPVGLAFIVSIDRGLFRVGADRETWENDETPDTVDSWVEALEACWPNHWYQLR